MQRSLGQMQLQPTHQFPPEQPPPRPREPYGWNRSSTPPKFGGQGDYKPKIEQTKEQEMRSFGDHAPKEQQAMLSTFAKAFELALNNRSEAKDKHAR